jgi:hypothetical protein
MTHDELIAYIDDSTDGLKHEHLFEKLLANTQALRAVVELHKPKEEDGKLWCEHEVCYNHIEFLERDDCDCSYPCPTIQAIEAELK